MLMGGKENHAYLGDGYECVQYSADQDLVDLDRVS